MCVTCGHLDHATPSWTYLNVQKAITSGQS